MRCYICKVVVGKLVLKEHESAKWLTKDNIDSLNWLPADQELIPIIKEII